MAAAASRDIRKQLSNIAECTVCCETFSDPRQLPCFHTYCLKCISGLSRGMRPGDQAPCPLCRNKFTIPDGGIGKLPTNFFMQQVLDIAVPRGNEGRPTSCQACSVVGSEQSVAKFCVQCSLRLCENCVVSHRRVKLTRKHEFVELNDNTGSLKTRKESIYCDEHAEEPLELYCYTCNEVTCILCHVKSHKFHKCSPVNKVAREFQKQMTDDIMNMRETVTICHDLLKERNECQVEFNRMLDTAAKQICDRVDELKQLIDTEKTNLLKELLAIRTARNKQVKYVVGEIEQHLSFVESMVTYTKQLRDEGTASDVAEQTKALRTRARDLLKLDGIHKIITDLDAGEVIFSPPQSHGSSIVGKIHQKLSHESRRPTLKHVIPSDGRDVAGLTSINNTLFVLRHPSKSGIEVYETTTFTQQRTLRVAGLSDGWMTWDKTLTSCDVNNCLFVCDHCNVYKFDLSTDKVINWRVHGRPSGLSVNDARHVIVTCGLVNEIREYEPNGQLIRTIELQKSHVTDPWHAVQLTDSLLIVSHRGPEQGVSFIDAQGTVTATYRNGTTTKLLFGIIPQIVPLHLLNAPVQLTVAKNGSVLVVDRNNNRIVALDASLTNARDLTLPIDVVDLRDPRCLHLHESLGRLYVGEASGQRVVICDNVNFNLNY